MGETSFSDYGLVCSVNRLVQTRLFGGVRDGGASPATQLARHDFSCLKLYPL